MPAKKDATPPDSAAIAAAFAHLVAEIAARHQKTPALCLASVANGGIVLGQRLAMALEERMGRQIPTGILNIAFHRDDIASKPIPKNFIATDLPFDVDEATILLVDDVLFTGRTVRAALNEIFDQGRPERVELVVLCDRGNRRLPIQADYVGLTLPTSPTQTVRVVLSPEDPSQDQITLAPV